MTVCAGNTATSRESARVRAMVPLLGYQRADVESPDRFRWCCWSRQVGKSFTKSLRRIVRGMQRGRTQILISASERQAAELMIKVRQHCRVLNIVAEARGQGRVARGSASKLEVRLAGGVRVIALPANPETVRGYTGDVLLDEFAMHADDRAIWAAVFPTVLRGAGELDVASTPKGKGNLFYRLRGNELFGRSTVTLPQAIEAGLKADLEAIRRGIGDELLFRQEFLCEFLDEGDALLRHDQIAGCEDARLSKEPDWESLRAAAADLYVGVDVGRRRDLTVIWIVQRAGAELVTRGVIELAERAFREQFAVLSEVLGERGVRRCCMDAGGIGMQLAEMAEEEFGAHLVERVTFTAGLKEELAGRMRVLVERGGIRIPVDADIREDWHSIKRLVSGAGHVRYDASRTDAGHGDRFWAAALAVHAAGHDPGRVEYARTPRLTFRREGIW